MLTASFLLMPMVTFAPRFCCDAALRSAPFSADYIIDIAGFEFPTGTGNQSLGGRLALGRIPTRKISASP